MKKLFALLPFLSWAGLFCRAQVAVSKEPRHHNTFENTYVRVLDVHIAPGDTSLFHIHQTPSVFIGLSNVKTGSEVRSEDPKDAQSIGDKSVYFTGFYNQPRIHRVWNRDTAVFHVMDIELVNKNYKAIDAPLTQNGIRLLFDEQPVRGYMLTLNAGAALEIKQRKAPMLIVNLTDSSALVNQKQFGHKGDFLFIPSNSTITCTNKEAMPIRFAVLEFK